MVRLMNSAMMPVPGRYIAKIVSPEDAAEILKKNNYVFKSYVGYPDTAAYMTRVLGVEIPVSREQTILEPGDIMLVCKLKYRLQTPTQKGTFVPQDSDYEWWVVEYQGE